MLSSNLNIKFWTIPQLIYLKVTHINSRFWCAVCWIKTSITVPQPVRYLSSYQHRLKSRVRTIIANLQLLLKDFIATHSHLKSFKAILISSIKETSLKPNCLKRNHWMRGLMMLRLIKSHLSQRKRNQNILRRSQISQIRTK